VATDFKTADLCDAFPEVEVAEPGLRDYGGRRRFGGPIRTLKVFEDNTLVRQALEQPGQGHVLVVDGGGSLRCALLGDVLAELAVKNGWAGVILYGALRDSEALGQLPLGVKALGTHPRKSHKRGEGQGQVPVRFLGVTFHPGHHVYGDADGLVVAARALGGPGLS
jgi:regulator of ribonuclease activity A